MLNQLSRITNWIGLLPAKQTEPAQLEQAPLTMRRIVDLESEDFAALVKFVLANPRYLQQTQHRQPTRSDAIDIATDLPPGANPTQKYLWGVWHGGVMIGFVEAIRHWPQAHHLYIGQLMIGERWQRQGHGSTVLNMLAERSRNWSGVRRWRLAVVATQDSALAFWRAMGFVATGQRATSRFYQAELITMEKIVSR